MSLLSRDQQIAVIAALTEGYVDPCGRAADWHPPRHHHAPRGARGPWLQSYTTACLSGRLELDELWADVGKKQRHLKRGDSPEKGDQYTFIALASSSRAIVAYRHRQAE